MRRSARVRTVMDVLLAAVIVTVGQLDLWLGSGNSIPEPKWVSAVVFAVMGCAVAVRRRYPLAALLFALGVFSVANVVIGSSEAAGGFLALLVLQYSCGAYEPRRRGLYGLGVASAAMVIHEVFDAVLSSLADYLGASIFDLAGVGAWFAGAYVRTRRELLAELRDRAERAALAERARIARELHDLVAHGVTVMVLHAEAADEVMDQNPTAAHQAVRRVQQAGRQSLVELRKALGVLGTESPALAPQPGCDQLRSLVETTEAAGLPVTLHWTGGSDITGAMSVSVYRIVQEALTNVLRHAHASRASVEITVTDQLRVVVEDDGVGPGRLQEGNGLTGIRARAEMFGGWLRAGYAVPHGLRLEVTLPLETT